MLEPLLRLRPHFLCVLILTACADGAARDGASTSDGPPAMVSIQSEAAYDSLTVMRLHDLGPLCREDADVCEPDWFPAAAVNNNGDVLFLGSVDKQPQVYRVDRQSGRPVPVGRNGAGPGEYRAPWALHWTPGGEALVASPPDRRLLRYAADGSPLATAPIPLPVTFFAAGFADGEFRSLATEEADEPGDSMAVIMFALDSGARSSRRIYRTDIRTPSYAADALRPPLPPFSPHPQWLVRRNGGLLHSTSERLVFDIYGPSGRHERRVGFEAPRHVVSSEEIEKAKAESTRRVRDPRMREALNAYWSREGAKHYPAITDIVETGGEGQEIWVRESPVASTDSVSWVIFSKEGVGYARVITSDADRIFVAHGDSILISSSVDAAYPESLHWMRLEPK